MRNTKSVTISLPPEQLKTAERLAKKESRTMSELFREALRRYEQQEQWRPSTATLAEFGELVKLIRENAKTAGMDKTTEAEIEAEVEAARNDHRTKVKAAGKRSRK